MTVVKDNPFAIIENIDYLLHVSVFSTNEKNHGGKLNCLNLPPSNVGM